MESIEVKKKKWASVHHSNGFISVSANSGYRSSATDPELYHRVMPDDCSDEELGDSIRIALIKSRFLPVEEVREFFHLKNVEQRYSVFVKYLLEEMGDIPRAKAFRKMKLCHICFEDGKVQMSPTKKARGEAWEGTSFTTKNTQYIEFNSTPRELGAAIREAIGFCK